MKKLTAIILSLALILSIGITAFADGTTTLTTTVPDASYTLNIPADQNIAFGTLSHKFENAFISDSQNFAVGKNVEVTISYTPFTNSAGTCSIPYSMKLFGDSSIDTPPSISPSGTAMVYKGNFVGGVADFPVGTYTIPAGNTGAGNTREVPLNKIYIYFNSSDWGKALGGDYSATITFTSEIVVEQ